MKIAEFIDFSVKPGRIDFIYTKRDGESVEKQGIWFELERGIIPSNDAIALAVATFIGTAFETVIIDLPVTMKTKENIEKFTHASVEVPMVVEKDVPSIIGEKLILNFSGGFDSLAAMYLLPEKTELVAIDFGGWFERESIFFERFRPHILKTNFRQLKLDRNSWTFMGVGALLYCEALGASYNVFGTIMEATPMHFLQKPPATNNNATSPFCYLGLKDIRYMNGLTEVGTAMVVSYYAPEIANESLVSLSNPKTEKRYRKEILLDIVCKKFGRNVVFDRTLPPDSKIPFGRNFALDFLSLYILKNRGLEVVEQTVSDIPQEASALVEDLQLRFYERINCEYLNGNTFVNNEARGDFLCRLLRAGVLPYTENDYREFRQVADFLNRYHHFYKG